MLEILNESNFAKYIQDGLKLVMFGSDICQYCVKEQPVLEELAEGNINIGKVDAYKVPKLAQKYNITAFPTFVLFKSGDVASQFSGFRTKSELLDTVLKAV